MFSLEEANQLRDSLQEIDFKTPVSDDAVVQSYIKYYGLDFNSSEQGVTHSMGCFSSQQFKVACQYFALSAHDTKGTVVIVHGYYDHVGLYNHLIGHCLSSGYSVIAFDLPGHGISSGEAASIESFDHYSEALADCLQLAQKNGLVKPWYLLGQSMGGATIINSLLKPQQFSQFQFNKIVLLAPLLKPSDWVNGQIRYFLFHLFVKRVKRDFVENTHDEEFLKFIFENDPLQSRYLPVDWVGSLKQYLKDFDLAPESQEPIHIIQGTDDNTVDWQYNLPALSGKFPNARTYIIDHARHHLVNDSVDFRGKVFATIDEIIAP